MDDIVSHDVVKVVDELALGDHAALFYRTKAEQLACMIPYVAIGLARNERCLYIADDNSVAFIRKRLEQAGVDVEACEARNALSIVTKRETYLRHGVFESEKMIADLHEEVRSAVAKGFNGLRASGEMTWALDLPSARARMVQYEEALQAEFPARFLAVCQYDETRYPKLIVDRMKTIHPVVIRAGQITRATET